MNFLKKQNGSRSKQARHLLFALFLFIFITIFPGCGGSGGDDTQNSNPTAQMEVSTDTGSAPLTVEFDASGSSDSDGSITAYAWDFGDGGTGSGESASHTYTETGTFTAQLTVTDDDGLTDSATHEIIIQEDAPEAAFSVSTTSGSAPLTVAFDASSSTDSNGNITAYAWNFGDGDTGSGVTTSHTYSETGTFTAVLTVTDDENLTDSATKKISVQESASQTYSISGTVTSASYAVSDSDTNDTNATSTSNDSFDDAQSITDPITVSGYVSANSDPDDYFLVTLTEDTAITLVMESKSPNADLNLYLYDENENQEDASLTSGDSVDSITVEDAGTYYIRIEAATDGPFRTASGYALSIGRTSTASAKYPLTLSDAFVPGQVLIRFNDQASANEITRLAGDGSQVSVMGFTASAGETENPRLLKPSSQVDRETLFENLGIAEAVSHAMAPGKMDETTRAKMETLWMVRGLSNQSGVKYVEPNYIRQAMTVPGDTYYSYQWHYPLINLPSAWDITTGNSDVEVAVIDTGVLFDHPDLTGQFLDDGYDFISDTEISLDGDGVDDDPADPGDQDDVDDGSSFHGTHVSGTIAALSDNDTGVAGVAWNTKILPLRVLGYGGGTSYDIQQAVLYAAGLSTDYDGIRRDHAVDVINLSLGGTSYSKSEAEVYEEAREAGVIIIAAAGNNGNTIKSYPAAYDGVVSVSAVGYDEALASYSSYGETVDIAAPGGSSTDSNGDGYVDGVLSTIGDDSSGDIEMGYAFCIGTSMAAPHVAGVVALMKAVFPGMTPDNFDALLQAGSLTTDLGDSDWDEEYGWGLIDAYKAVQVAYESGENGDLTPILSVSPSSLSFGTSQTSAEVTVSNSGGEDEDDPLEVTDIVWDADWLTVTASSVDIYGLGTYAFSVSRDGLEDGTYSTSVTFTSDVNTAQVTVSMKVGSTEASSDGGYHYILLLDADTLETVEQVETSGENGVYTYTFSGLSYGDTYAIYAGTNPDGDNYICENTEACGAYLSLDEPATVTIDGDLENLDFSTDISVNLSSGVLSDTMPLALKMD